MNIKNSIKQYRKQRQYRMDRLGTREKTKERLGLASRQAQESKSMALQRADQAKRSKEEVYDPLGVIDNWMEEYEAVRKEFGPFVPDETDRPEARYKYPTQEFENPTAQAVKDGLVERGLPEHVAQGFVWNFKDESGLDPDIVESEPNVHGTRGKGIYQLTGSRRDKFEELYGNNYSLDNQLDFLVWELENTEKSAGQEILNSSTASEAAVNIVTRFLRPAEEHRKTRVNKYLAYGGQQ